MVSVMFVDGNLQLFTMGMIYSTYLFAAASVKPWVISWLNAADTTVSLWTGLLMMAAMMSSISLGATVREHATHYLNTVTYVSFIYASLGGAVVFYMVYATFRAEHIEEREKAVAGATRHALRMLATIVMDDAAPLDDLERYATDEELRDLLDGIRTVLRECYCQDLETVGLRSAKHRLFRQTAAGDPSARQVVPPPSGLPDDHIDDHTDDDSDQSDGSDKPLLRGTTE